jgi:ABC-type Fe3+ transport system permease subunit
VPITLGTVLIAEGMLTYFGPKGWLAQFLQLVHLYDGPIRLTHNYTGVLISLVVSGFPFAFLLILSYVTGIDPGLARAAATLGADPKAQFRYIYLPLLAPGLAMCFCLSFVQAFSVFPSAVLLGSPAGPTRVISIAAYEAAFEQYDYSLASAIAMIMGFVQLVIVVAVLGLRNLFYRGRSWAAKVSAMNDPSIGAVDDARAARARRSHVARAAPRLMTLFVVNIGLMIAAVATSSFARRWLGTWLPKDGRRSGTRRRGRNSSSTRCCGSPCRSFWPSCSSRC